MYLIADCYSLSRYDTTTAELIVIRDDNNLPDSFYTWLAQAEKLFLHLPPDEVALTRVVFQSNKWRAEPYVIRDENALIACVDDIIDAMKNSGRSRHPVRHFLYVTDDEMDRINKHISPSSPESNHLNASFELWWNIASPSSFTLYLRAESEGWSFMTEGIEVTPNNIYDLFASLL